MKNVLIIVAVFIFCLQSVCNASELSQYLLGSAVNVIEREDSIYARISFAGDEKDDYVPNTAVTYSEAFMLGVNGSMLFDTVQRASRKLAEEYWSDNQNNIIDIIANSFLEGYDRYNIRYNFINAVSVSTTYSVLSRCGADPDGYFEREDFLPVFDFNTAETISELGTAVSGINQQILREIERTVKIYERARFAERTENHERTDLHEERGLLYPEPQLSRNEGGIRQGFPKMQRCIHGIR